LLCQFLEGGDLRAELFEFHRSRVFIHQLIAVRIIEIVFVLLSIRQPSLQYSQAFGTLGGSEHFEFLQEVFLLLEATLD